MKKITQQHTRNNFQPVAANFKPQPNKVVKQNLKRDLPKIAPHSPSNLIQKIRLFMNSDSNYYLGFGGLGDALLLLATCWDDPKAKVVYFANYIPFVKQFFELFNVPVYLEKNIMGTQVAGQVFDFMKSNPKFKQSAHLADGLYFGDWKNENKYINRIKRYVPWAERLGKEKFDKPVVIIAPSGSNKDIQRQRYLHHHEYQQLVDLHLDKNYRVYATGSMADLHHFKLINKDNFYWLCSDNIYSGNGNVEKIDLRKMLRIINSAVHVISMDSWLKSYTLLCNILTKVVKTRWDGKYKPYGEDVTDWIFLNTDIWPSLKMTTIEELLT